MAVRLNRAFYPHVDFMIRPQKRSAMFFRGLALSSLLLLAACATPPALDGAASRKAFVPEKFFVGQTFAEGEFVNTIDGSRRGLTAKIRGTFDGQKLTLVEDFLFSDGERDRKTWVLTKTGPATYTGTREDVIGDAKGLIDGPFFRLTYKADVKTKNSSIALTFDDVLGYEPDGSVLNRAVVSKLGVKVGEVTLRMRRVATKS
jgi:hypothetical protein